MPSRLITAGILLFWLSMTGWLVHRELVPMMIAEASPSFQIDLTDEIGSPTVYWTVLLEGKNVGSATSKINALDDRRYEFRSTYHFRHFAIELGKIKLAEIKQLDSRIYVSEEGKLLSFAAKVHAHVLVEDVVLELKGDVENQMLQPRMFKNGIEEKFMDIGPIDMARQGSAVSPMHLMNRLRGLHVGQSWRISNLDLLGGVKNPLVSGLAKQGYSVPALMAEVKIGTLHWDRKEVACYQIEYYEPGKDEILARTWVRKIDGLVLQQEASVMGRAMISQRVPG